MRTLAKTLACCLLAVGPVTQVAHAQDQAIVIDAHTGVLGADWQVLMDGDIQYVTAGTDFANRDFPSLDAKVITYTITFPYAGTFELYAQIRVGPANYNDDSFFVPNGFGLKSAATQADWVMVNGVVPVGYTRPNDVVSGGGSTAGGVWKWLNISGYLGATAPAYVVPAGELTQTFQLGSRENGLDISRIAFGRAGLFYTVTNLALGQAGSPIHPGDNAPTHPPLAHGQDKWLGNIFSRSQLRHFTAYWNQVTPENAGKWGSVEWTRDQMNWADLDSAYNLAKRNGFPFRFHALVWGNQQPAWIETLDSLQQIQEVEEWFTLVAQRYPDIDYLEVVNEPLHDPPRKTSETDQGAGDYFEALGGAGESGWEWVLNSFRMARRIFPDSVKLMLNDYNIVSSSSNAERYKGLIELLQQENLIDLVGVQGHAFSTRGSAASILSNLNIVASTGLPIQVTEMEIDGPTDLRQLTDFMRVFPVFWEHPQVMGVTLWGFRPGLWRHEERAYLIDENEAIRPALTWLKAYVQDTLRHITSVNITTPGNATSIDTIGGTLQLSASILPANATTPFVTWSVSHRSIATIAANGLLTAVGPGQVLVTATAIGAPGVTDTITITIGGGLTSAPLQFASTLRVYPNPASQVIHIASPMGIAQVTLLSVTGQVVKRVAPQAHAVELGLGHLPNGLYILQVRAFNGEQHVTRVVKR